MTIDERRVTTALRAYTGGVEVTDADLDRLEAGLHERLRPAPRLDAGRRRVWEWAVAACAVVALVLGGTALWRTRAQDTMPATPSITPADLAGVWLVHAERGDTWLWHFGVDGRLAFSSTPAAYLIPDDRTTYTLQGDVLTWVEPGPVCRATVRLSLEGRMSLTPLPDGPLCSFLSDGTVWPLVRVSPTSVAGATVAPRGVPALQREAAAVETRGDLAGTWLLRGTGTLLVVGWPTPGVGARYVVDDDGDGHSRPDQWGMLTVGPGGVVLRPGDGTGQACETRFTEVVSDGVTLEAHLADSSCGRLGGVQSTWVRLN